jgi:NAD(P)-dependent dehydrogenase (short-subunit alcohol dehydrogenase family)
MDIACINAGVGVGGKFVDTDLDEELNLINLNCAHTVHFAKHVVQQMVPRGAGKDPVYGFHCERDGGSARGSVRRVQSVCVELCA